MQFGEPEGIQAYGKLEGTQPLVNRKEHKSLQIH